MSGPVEWICEIEPPTRPDLMHVRHQIGVLSTVATAYLIPDNHVGRATVSSIAVAHEVDRMGGRSIACLNARDRNALGFRRDLLTGAAYGVDEFLFVYGDDPAAGARTGQLTVRSMIDALRQFGDEHLGDAGRFRAGVTTRLRPLPDWKRAADFLFVQVSFDLDALLAWRDTVDFAGAVYAGVMVLPSAAMARKLVAAIPEITVPQPWLDAIERDGTAGTALACELAQTVAGSGAFDGIHLIPGVRYRETAARLEGRRR
ncbi:MAG TPA: methylenetetrahydrofolate reductase [Acidimicrobiales bacterium]|nr:methylenetetrahydrofolate reductase [Acidimicrobiales bacterium]